MATRSKRYASARERIDRARAYDPAEAISILKDAASANFDETVEVHFRLGVNVRHADEQLRGTLALPHGLGKDVTIAVFAEGDNARAASEAGADFVGSDDLAERVEAGWTDFDVAIASPDQMPKVGRLGRVLGPQGKMPNPKVGTVTDDVAKAVSEAKAGKVEYRTDRQAIVHLAIGKASFEERALLANYAAIAEEIVRAKPAGAKGRYLLSITMTTTMGPGIRLDPTKVSEADILGRDAAATNGGPGGDGSAQPEPAEAKAASVPQGGVDPIATDDGGEEAEESGPPEEAEGSEDAEVSTGEDEDEDDGEGVAESGADEEKSAESHHAAEEAAEGSRNPTGIPEGEDGGDESDPSGPGGSKALDAAGGGAPPMAIEDEPSDGTGA